MWLWLFKETDSSALPSYLPFSRKHYFRTPSPHLSCFLCKLTMMNLRYLNRGFFRKNQTHHIIVICEVQAAVSRDLPIIPFRIEDVKISQSFWSLMSSCGLGTWYWLGLEGKNQLWASTELLSWLELGNSQSTSIDLCIVEHFRDKRFLRGTKNAFISLVPSTLLDEVEASEPIAWTALRKRMDRKHQKYRFNWNRY